MSNLYLTRETAEALRKALDEGTTPVSRCVKVYHLLDSLPVVDAVPAAEALERMAIRAEWAAMQNKDRSEVPSQAADMLAVRHALRAAQAQADAPPPPDVIRRGHEALPMLQDRAFPRDAAWCDEENPTNAELASAVRAAMHPLPKETP